MHNYLLIIWILKFIEKLIVQLKHLMLVFKIELLRKLNWNDLYRVSFFWRFFFRKGGFLQIFGIKDIVLFV
jgi:hypothetical protein